MPQFTADKSGVYRDGLIFAKVSYGPVSLADDEASAVRIAACLQACEGIGTESLQENGATSYESVVAMVKRPTAQVLRPAFPPVLARSDNESGYRPDAEDLADLYEFHFETRMGLVLDCRLEHTPLEVASFDHAGSAAQIELIWAMVEGVSVEELLSAELALQIEIAALDDMKEKAEAERMAA